MSKIETFFDGAHISAALSSSSAYPGQTLITPFKSEEDIFSREPESFLQFMKEVQEVAKILVKYYYVPRCGLVYDASSHLSLIPMHGVGKEWQPITNNMKEFNDYYPGYVSSLDGPRMEDKQLDQIRSLIQTAHQSAALCQYNYLFKGNQSDQSLFARIIRGECQHWRVWDDDSFVAFLTPFPNTPRFTVLVPRVHLSSDIFSICGTKYANLMLAARTVANLLKVAFNTNRCGMIFEGFEIDYAHVKLMPVCARAENDAVSFSTSASELAQYETTYKGYLTSLRGPPSDYTDSIVAEAKSLRESYAGKE